MANDKRFVAQKRHHRRRKAAKANMKLYEQGKITYDQLSMLGRTMLVHKRSAEARAKKA
jgi:hypothetical protein